MSLVGRPKLANCISFVIARAIRMETLNLTAIFEDVAELLNIGTPQIIQGHKVVDKIVDEEV